LDLESVKRVAACGNVDLDMPTDFAAAQIASYGFLNATELQRKLEADRLACYAERFGLYERVLKQKRYDKNKIYSLHEPHVYCMSKGKPHKRYEYGTKASIAVTRDSKIIVGALGFDSNQYDGHILPAVVSQIKRVMNGHEPGVLLCDRGYRGKDRVNNAQVLRPQANVKTASEKMRELMRERFRKRAGIEAVIGHLKVDHRLDRNFLKGFVGDQINLLMAAAAFNLRKWMRLIIFWLKMWLGDMVGVRFTDHAHIVAA
jgi:IS5 family transposase